jgi:hypothetical protein
MELLWVLFLLVLNYIWPVVVVIFLIIGLKTIVTLKREIQSLRSSKGNTAALELEILRYKGKFFSILSYIFGLGGLILAISQELSPQIAILAGVILYLPFKILSAVNRGKYNQQFKEKYVAVELSKVFNNLDYRHNEGFSASEIILLNFFAHTDLIVGSDLIEAKYKGLSFKQSDINIKHVWTETETDDEGNSTEVTHEKGIFLGRIMKFDLPYPCQKEVWVLSEDFDGAKRAPSGWQKIETEMAEFGELFNVYSEDQLQALSVLKPQMIEGIYWTEQAVDMPVAFIFKDHTMYTFLTLGYDAFESSGKTLLKAKEQLQKDITLMTDFLDTMYFHNASYENGEVGNGSVSADSEAQTE